ncbi:MAG TPA: hypothetical protein VGK73_29960 [Polyangiaceae bacterium]
MNLPLAPSPLEALCASRLGDGFFVRAGRWYGWGIAVSYGLLIAFDPGDPGALLLRGLGTLAWIVGGIYGLAAARDTGDGETDGVLALARARGFTRRELERARAGTSVRRTLHALAGPALLLALVPAFRAESSGELANGLARTLGVLSFVVILSASVACAARLSALLSPGHGRTALLGCVLLPHAARSLWPSLPSIPSLLGALLEWAVRLGHA